MVGLHCMKPLITALLPVKWHPNIELCIQQRKELLLSYESLFILSIDLSLCGPENKRPGFCNSEYMTVLRCHSIGDNTGNNKGFK